MMPMAQDRTGSFRCEVFFVNTRVAPIPHEFHARRRRQRGVLFVCRQTRRYLDAIESAAKTI
jgi:hypothetical protein